ncbi:MAG: HlyD family efflux transporter periplasmic adaptor subunit, partial [Pseudomonadota bacterium]
MLRKVPLARGGCVNGDFDAGRGFAARVAIRALGIICALGLAAPAVVAQPATGSAAIPAPMADDEDQAIESAAPPRGIIVALARAALTTELNVPVSEIGFREAEVFDKGDLLIAFDCRRQQAELKSAEAKAAEARMTLQNFRYLKRRRATGAHDVAVAAARYKQAEADVDAIKVVLDGCQVRAPFRGAVSSLSLRVHERPSVGEPFMRIVSNEAFELEMIVPSTWLKWLRPGRAFRFH